MPRFIRKILLPMISLMLLGGAFWFNKISSVKAQDEVFTPTPSLIGPTPITLIPIIIATATPAPSLESTIDIEATLIALDSKLEATQVNSGQDINRLDNLSKQTSSEVLVLKDEIGKLRSTLHFFIVLLSFVFFLICVLFFLINRMKRTNEKTQPDNRVLQTKKIVNNANEKTIKEIYTRILRVEQEIENGQQNPTASVDKKLNEISYSLQSQNKAVMQLENQQNNLSSIVSSIEIHLTRLEERVSEKQSGKEIVGSFSQNKHKNENNNDIHSNVSDIVLDVLSVYEPLIVVSSSKFVPLETFLNNLQEAGLAVDSKSAYSLLESIAKKYPGAIRVENVRGKKGQHIAIVRDYLQ